MSLTLGSGCISRHCMSGGAMRTDVAEGVIDVTRVDGVAVREAVVANDRGEAEANVRRLHDILAAAPAEARIYFPAGDYYLHGSAVPNRGSIESTAAGQVFYGDGPQVSRLVQTDLRRDFGFNADPARKHVPAATLRIGHKGSAARDLGFIVDPAAEDKTVIPTAAVQVAHVRYFPDNNIGIVETTGNGVDFLVDHVLIQDIQVGEDIGQGIQGSRFFSVGIDIVGSGGHVRVFNVHRMDARIGVRLDNGNHCGQGEYWFQNIHMVGRPGVTGGGCLFDWVGGQAPMIFNCSAAFTNGLHAGALGIDGDRLEPFAEGAVVRREGKSWDWLTWHDHPVVDEPNHEQRTSWYGLPREAKVVHIGSEPRTGGTEWTEGTDYRIERIDAKGDLFGASKIHWITAGPEPGSVYFIAFEQPKEYRPHDLEWGILDSCSLQEAQQADPEGYVVKFHDQGYGVKNPDFHFPVGFGFGIRHNFTLTGDLIFRGDVGVVKVSDNVFGTGTTFIEGMDADHPACRFTFEDNLLVKVVIGDQVRDLSFTDNQFFREISADAPTLGSNIRISENSFVLDGPPVPEDDPRAKKPIPTIRLSGAGIREFQIEGNRIRNPLGDGIAVRGGSDGTISNNTITECAGAGARLVDCAGMVVSGNTIARNTFGLVVMEETRDASAAKVLINGNALRANAKGGLVLPSGEPRPDGRFIVTDNLITEGP